jgi:hypothetical protein
VAGRCRQHLSSACARAEVVGQRRARAKARQAAAVLCCQHASRRSRRHLPTSQTEFPSRRDSVGRPLLAAAGSRWAPALGTLSATALLNCWLSKRPMHGALQASGSTVRPQSFEARPPGEEDATPRRRPPRRPWRSVSFDVERAHSSPPRQKGSSPHDPVKARVGSPWERFQTYEKGSAWTDTRGRATIDRFHPETHHQTSHMLFKISNLVRFRFSLAKGIGRAANMCVII